MPFSTNSTFITREILMGKCSSSYLEEVNSALALKCTLSNKKEKYKHPPTCFPTNPTVGAGREVSIITCALSDDLTLFSLLANNKKLGENVGHVKFLLT